VPLVVDLPAHRAILDFMVRSMQLRIGVVVAALLLLSSAQARGEWSAEQVKWIQACQLEALGRFAVSDYAFQAIDMTIEPAERRVWLRFGPESDPQRHGMGCVYDERGKLKSVALVQPDPPKRPAR
jgi:hypothetical protein